MSSPFDLDRAVEALRIEHEDSPGDDADGTRWRIRESLDHARVVRSRLIATLVVCGVLSTGGVSWAYLSGRLEGVWPWLTNIVGGERVVDGDQPKKPQDQNAARLAIAEPPASKTVAPSVRLEPTVAEAPRAEPLPQLVQASELPAPPVVAKAPRPAKPRLVERTVAEAPRAEPAAPAAKAAPSISTAEPAATAEPALAAAPDLYRAAHQLHFHGSDPAAALAAWDKYLASESSGRFAVEARYNRAMTLIRLRRYREAHIALDPFARGEVQPAGYRQSEAKQLSERLQRAIFGDKPAAEQPATQKPSP